MFSKGEGLPRREHSCVNNALVPSGELVDEEHTLASLRIVVPVIFVAEA